MRKFIQPGDSLAVAVPYASGVSSGQGVLVGALFGVAAVDGDRLRLAPNSHKRAAQRTPCRQRQT